VTARGLTWDHPRGRDALEEAARRANAGRAEPLISWAVQPLEGFESAPLADLAARHDLIVMDHPHVGEAAAEACLTPLDELYPPETLRAWEAASVGPALASYRWEGRTYALPLDVAAQVCARRPDRLPAPTGWAEVEEMAARGGVALSLAGPHALLTLMSMAAGAGHWAGGAAFLPDDAFALAYGRMRRLHARAAAGADALNPIALLEAMSRGDGIALVPLVFGYVTYASAAAPGARLAFTDPPGIAADGAGGVLGGTGIAFSARARPSAELLDHVAGLMTREAQAGLIADHGGQPSARAAWRDARVDAAAGGFYSGTLASVERAFLRPRFDGVPAFQTAASARLRRALAAGDAASPTLAALRDLWRAARARARGPLDDDRRTAS
jgi:multiple sugar transport system substrate-binding protein